MSITDPLYGVVSLSPMIQKVLAHPAVQRLDAIGQLGFSRFTDPRLCHTRGEHCRGTMYLASLVARIFSLDNKSAELLQLAALLHDCGHGPFSHSFEKLTPVRHEVRSQQIARRILCGMYTPLEIETVCYLIDPGGPPPTRTAALLKDIVANKTCHVDIDKMDYLMRDSFYAKRPFCKVEVILDLLYTSDIVVDANGIGKWTFDPSHKGTIELIFNHRQAMFKEIYHHPNNILLDRRMVRAGQRLAVDWTDLDTFLQYTDVKFLAAISHTPEGKALLVGNCGSEDPDSQHPDLQTPDRVLSKVPYHN